jgi:hypothetical protein
VVVAGLIARVTPALGHAAPVLQNGEERAWNVCS